MSNTSKAAICVFANGNSVPVFERCFNSILKHTPPDQFELRLAFSQADKSLCLAVGALSPNGVWLQCDRLPDGFERVRWTARQGFPVRAWHTERHTSRENLARLMFHDLPLESEYAICLDQSAAVEAGWWEALAPLLERKVDYIGHLKWRDYLPGEKEQIERHSWYLGVPQARRDGRPGVSYLGGEFMAVRAERLRQVNFPCSPGFAPGCDVLLGAIAHQMRWTQATHDDHVLLVE